MSTPLQQKIQELIDNYEAAYGEHVAAQRLGRRIHSALHRTPAVVLQVRTVAVDHGYCREVGVVQGRHGLGEYRAVIDRAGPVHGE